jgi:hypothetical protein
MKPGLVAHDDRLLVQPLGQRLDVVEDIVGGDDSANNLDELHHRRRVEEVHPQDPRGLLRGDGKLGDREGRGVGGEDRVVGDDRIERGEDLLLEGQVLGNRLDDELAPGELGKICRIADPPVQRLGVLGGEFAAADGPGGRLGEDALAMLECVAVDLDRDDRQAVTGEDLGDPRAHRAQSDDAYCGEFACHCASLAGPDRLRLGNPGRRWSHRLRAPDTERPVCRVGGIRDGMR